MAVRPIHTPGWQCGEVWDVYAGLSIVQGRFRDTHPNPLLSPASGSIPRFTFDHATKRAKIQDQTGS